MTVIDDLEWLTYDVPSGSVIAAESERVVWQRVQWLAHSDRYGDLDGYIN